MCQRPGIVGTADPEPVSTSMLDLDRALGNASFNDRRFILICGLGDNSAGPVNSSVWVVTQGAGDPAPRRPQSGSSICRPPARQQNSRPRTDKYFGKSDEEMRLGVRVLIPGRHPVAALEIQPHVGDGLRLPPG